MNDEPSVQEMAQLWSAVYNYIAKKKISCVEAVYEDRVTTTAADLVGDLCDIVGYYEYDETE